MPKPQSEILQKQGLERSTDVSDAALNPCFKEQTVSHNCIAENMGRREKCVMYFANYNACKRFWKEVIKTRRKHGEFPHLPSLENRDAVRKHYQELWSKS